MAQRKADGALTITDHWWFELNLLFYYMVSKLSLFATGARREFHYFLSLFLNTIVRIMESWGAVSLIHKKFPDIDLDPHQKYLKSWSNQSSFFTSNDF